MTNSKDKLSAKLGWVSFLNDCSSEVISRSLPLVLVGPLGISPTAVGLIEGLADALGLFLRIFSGWLSDRLSSRKPLIVFGYSLSFLAKLSLINMQMPLFFAVSRIFDRAGKGLRTAPRDAMIADSSEIGKSGKEFGILRFLDTIGACTGIFIALWFGIGNQSQIDFPEFRTIVSIAVPFAMLSILLLIFTVPKIPRKVIGHFKFQLMPPKEIRPFLCLVFFFALSNSSDAFIVIRAQQLGFTFKEILEMFFVFNIVAAFIAAPIGKLSDKYGRSKFLLAGWIVYSLVYFFIGIDSDKTIFAMSIIFYGAFYGFTEGVEKAMLADLLPAHSRGLGYGSLEFVFALAAIPSNLLMGYLMKTYGSSTAFLSSSAISITATIAFYFWQISKVRRSS